MIWGMLVGAVGGAWAVLSLIASERHRRVTEMELLAAFERQRHASKRLESLPDDAIAGSFKPNPQNQPRNP
jgi:hypothetical protein